MSKKDIIDLRTIFAEAFDTDPSETIKRFHSEMQKLIEEEFLSTEQIFVYIVERRGSNLFRPFIGYIGKFHETGTIRLYGDKRFARIKEGACNNGKQCIVLTDAIRKGYEISKIIELLNELDIKVLKVCGYLSNKETIEILRKKYNKIEFKFVHETIDYDHYKEHYGKLVGVHHSRLEPLDSEHPYYLYQAKKEIEEEKIGAVIRALCNKANYTYREKDLLSKDIIGYSAEFESDYAFKLLALNPKNTFFDIERLQLRFRYDKSKSLMRMMTFCEVCGFNLEKISLMDKYIKKAVPNFESYCNLIDEMPSNHEVICPLCLDVNLSLTTLEKIDPKIKKLSVKEGFNLKTIRVFNPFLNF